jgi:uridylate kinase
MEEHFVFQTGHTVVVVVGGGGWVRRKHSKKGSGSMISISKDMIA